MKESRVCSHNGRLFSYPSPPVNLSESRFFLAPLDHLLSGKFHSRREILHCPSVACASLTSGGVSVSSDPVELLNFFWQKFLILHMTQITQDFFRGWQ